MRNLLKYLTKDIEFCIFIVFNTRNLLIDLFNIKTNCVFAFTEKCIKHNHSSPFIQNI